MRTSILLVAAIALLGGGIARADLVQKYTAFDTVWEIGVSGLQSSYAADTMNAAPVNGATTGSFLPVFGPSRVSYPNGVGEVPSPGGSVGSNFDEGALGVRVDGNQLTLQLASRLNPRTGYYYDGYQSWYGQGDLFVDVVDSTGVGHFALLSAWGRDAQGNPISLNGGHFNTAQSFHLTGGASDSSLEGHLVRLGANADVTVTGGTGAYNSGNAPSGLDLRTFAAAGSDLGTAGLTHSSVVDQDQTWYVQTWTVNIGDLSSDGSFGIGLHSIVSCGTDQIGGQFAVTPEPASLVLVLAGLLFKIGRRG
jgi:hypothetical protein